MRFFPLALMTVAATVLPLTEMSDAMSFDPPGSSSGASTNGRSWWTWADTRRATKPGRVGTVPSSRDNGSEGAATCTYVPAKAPAGQEARKGSWYLAFCGPGERLFGVNTDVQLVFVPEGDSAPTVTPYELALEARQQLRPVVPAIRTAPPRGREGLVGLPHFFWMERSQWRATSKRAEAGPVWAEVTATPSRLVIKPGADQRSVTCAGPGTPYTPSQSPDRQAASCSHVYTRSSAGLPASQYEVTVSVVWTATWAGSGGTGGRLAPISTSTTFPVRIAEGQALIQRSS
jgi:hypothetical protein